MGISGMKKRVREAGGTIDFWSVNIEELNVESIGSDPGHGFKISMLLPIHGD